MSLKIELPVHFPVPDGRRDKVFQGSLMLPNGRASFSGLDETHRGIYEFLRDRYQKDGKTGIVLANELKEIVRGDNFNGHLRFIKRIQDLLKETGWKVSIPDEDWDRERDFNRQYSLRPDEKSAAYLRQLLPPIGEMVKSPDVKVEKAKNQGEFDLDRLTTIFEKFLDISQAQTQARALDQVLAKVGSFPITDGLLFYKIVAEAVGKKYDKNWPETVRKTLNRDMELGKMINSETGFKLLDEAEFVLLVLYQRCLSFLVDEEKVKTGSVKPGNNIQKKVQSRMLEVLADEPGLLERLTKALIKHLS